MRRLIAFLAVLLSLFAAFSDPISWDTEIDGVSMGVDSFGWGLMPVGVSFNYETKFPLLPGQRKFITELDLEVIFNNTSVSEDYEWDTGTPRWAVTEAEAEGMEFLSGDYFNPRANAELKLKQGFWTNPNDPDEALLVITLGYYARYDMASELLRLSWSSNTDDPMFVDWYGASVYPYTESYLDAFPWLSGDRIVFSDYLYLRFQLQMDRDTPKDVEAEHGFYAALRFEYGPYWFFNNLTNGVQSDFFRVSLNVEQYMELYTVYQSNGWNWTNMYLGHADTLSFTTGDVIPTYRLNTDRLEWYLKDEIWLHFNGPQFFNQDCFAFVELYLENLLAWGHVQNEASRSTTAVELQSSVYTVLELQLFGFVRLQYEFGYDFIRGIWPDGPEFWQYGQIKFYLSL